MLGDILFYKQHTGNIIEDAIQDFEGKHAYVHCAIAISATQKIEALADGIVLSQIGKKADGIYLFPDTLKSAKLDQAYMWLKSQVGHAYGYLDIVDAMLSSFERQMLAPDTNYDCSALATQFLIEAGIPLPTTLTSNVHCVTPQELAIALLIK